MTGSNGQLGTSISRIMKDEFQIIETSKHGSNNTQKLDITNSNQIFSVLEEINPAYVINTAAFTDVDGCERNPEAATEINSIGAENVAKACSHFGAQIIHISTDYVFDGESGMYSEKSKTSPLQVYGESKLIAENLVFGSSEKSPIIVRTSGVFDSINPNFFTWIINSLRIKKELNIVIDQILSPTHVDFISETIACLIKEGQSGIWNVSCNSPVSRIDFAKLICDIFESHEVQINGIMMDDLDWDARRPNDSSLDCRKLEQLQKVISLHEMIKKYC